MRDTRGERSAKGNEGIKGHRRRRRLDRAAVDVVVCGLVVVVVVVRRSRRVTADASPGRVTAQNIPLRHHRSRPAAIIVIISDDTTDERSSTIPPVQRAKFLSKHGHVTSGQHRL